MKPAERFQLKFYDEEGEQVALVDASSWQFIAEALFYAHARRFSAFEIFADGLSILHVEAEEKDEWMLGPSCRRLHCEIGSSNGERFPR